MRNGCLGAESPHRLLIHHSANECLALALGSLFLPWASDSHPDRYAWIMLPCPSPGDQREGGRGARDDRDAAPAFGGLSRILRRLPPPWPLPTLPGSSFLTLKKLTHADLTQAIQNINKI